MRNFNIIYPLKKYLCPAVSTGKIVINKADMVPAFVELMVQ